LLITVIVELRAEHSNERKTNRKINEEKDEQEKSKERILLKSEMEETKRKRENV